MTRLPIRIVFVAYRGTNFLSGPCSHDQSLSGLVFYYDLSQTYDIALFGDYRTAKLAVPNIMSQGLKFRLEIQIFVRLDSDLF
jgi:hypothetical protein